MKTGKDAHNMAWKALATATLAGALMIAGCSGGHKYTNAEPAIQSSLTQNNLGAISVSQDRTKGVITLTGSVPTEEQKAQAESVAKTAAPSYTVVNEISVVPPANSMTNSSAMAAAGPSPADVAIQDEFSKEVKKQHRLADDNINITANNGDVVLSGEVRTKQDKRQAEKLAKKIDSVKSVQNNLEVNPHLKR